MNDDHPRPPRPAVAETRQRQIRVPDHPFYDAVARAKDEGTTIGHVTTVLLDRYARGELDV